MAGVATAVTEEEAPGGIAAVLEELVVRVCDGDQSAWQPLWCALDPWLDALVARRRLIGPLSRREDDRRSAVVAVMARLRQGQFQRLKLYRAERNRKPMLALMPWLAVVTKNVCVDYLLDVPIDAGGVSFGVLVAGPGAISIADVNLEVVEERAGHLERKSSQTQESRSGALSRIQPDSRSSSLRTCLGAAPIGAAWPLPLPSIAFA